MIFSEEFTVTDLLVYEVEFQKKESIYVPGRNFCALTFRLSGSKRLESGGETFLSEPGSITYMPPGLGYRSEILESGNMIAIHFHVIEKEAGNAPRILRPEDPRGFENLFYALRGRYQPRREKDYTCMSLLYEILAKISQECIDYEHQTFPKKILAAKTKIEGDFANPELTIEMLAQQLHISQVYLRRSFRLCFGVSPIQYLKQLRLENAKVLLRTSYYSVGCVAQMCGYSSLNYFSTEFRKATGVSPSHYWKLYNEEVSTESVKE